MDPGCPVEYARRQARVDDRMPVKRPPITPGSPHLATRRHESSTNQISFTRHFDKPQPLCSLVEISADILVLRERVEGAA